MINHENLLLRHILYIREVRKVAEAIKASGILAEEEAFFAVSKAVALQDEVIAHAVGNGGDGAWIVAPPHQFLHAYKVGGLLDSIHSPIEGIKL